MTQLSETKSFLNHTLTAEDSSFPATFELDSCQFHMPARGVLEVTPQHSMERELVISCGIHGNETAPIEIVEQLVFDVLVGRQKVHCKTLFVIGHPKAIQAGSRFIDINLNRLFSGHYKNYQNGQEIERAKLLSHSLDTFFQNPWQRLHFDLHTAIRDSVHQKFAVYPWRPDGDWDRDQLALLGEAGIEAVLLSHKPAATFSYFSAQQFNAAAFTLELGKVRPFGENPMAEFSAIDGQLRQLLLHPGLPEHLTGKKSKLPRLYQVVKELIRPEGADARLRVNDDVANFTAFPVGTEILSSRKEAYVTGSPEEAIVFPNRAVPVGQRMGLMVKPVELDT